MRRRRFLAAAGLATVPLAGCPSCSEPPDDTATPTASPTANPPTTSPPPQPSLAAELDSLQPAVVTLNVDALDVDGEPARQYCYLDVTVEAGDPDTTYHLEWTGERRSQDVRLVEADGGN